MLSPNFLTALAPWICRDRRFCLAIRLINCQGLGRALATYCPTGSISHQRQHFKLSIDDLCHDWKRDECLEMRLALVCQGCPQHVSCVAGGDHSIPSSRIGWLSLTTINGLFRFSSANMAMEPSTSVTGTAPCGSSLPTQTYCRVSKHAR